MPIETSILDSILNPLLKLDPLVAIILISVILSTIVTILYKYLTDQTLMKSLRDQLKVYQQQMKENRQNPEKIMEIQKKSMEVNMKYMMQSFKPMIFTFIPIILIFGWLNAHLAFEPITAGEEFLTTIEFKDITGSATIIVPEDLQVISENEQQINTVTDEGWLWDSEKSVATWNLKSDQEGEYLIEYKYNDKTYKKDVVVTSERKYAETIKQVNDDNVKTITIENEKMKPLKFNGLRLGWLATYIIFSILTNIILKKVLKIH